ncbi:transporter [Polymorphobacter multimanifer]|uniref:nicotinamide riboside transporter PnuC n=1 Tax=Polymorphobacter multimanifer TaxID=1070431 RepID=UPI001666D5B7|nr:nicotinamide riboside transporter PnuC [Polymorphobacter multimanifer]GGI78592.1 transporter [Polymorphobacter multimanifer]
MPPLEALAAAFGLANSLLLARRSVWNFPFGLVMVSLYAVVFLEARLFSAVLLQGFFIATQVWGWREWQQVAGRDDKVPVSGLSSRARLGAAAATLALALLLGLITSHFTTAAAPFLDAGNTSLSITAQLLTMARRVEAWPLWVVVNAVSVALYASQGLWIPTALYCVFLVLALRIWQLWRRAA